MTDEYAKKLYNLILTEKEKSEKLKELYKEWKERKENGKSK